MIKRTDLVEIVAIGSELTTEKDKALLLEKLLAAADYVTEMRKLRHPFDAGVPARKGVEY